MNDTTSSKNDDESKKKRIKQEMQSKQIQNDEQELRELQTIAAKFR
jgi:hypothetical protein